VFILILERYLEPQDAVCSIFKAAVFHAETQHSIMSQTLLLPMTRLSGTPPILKVTFWRWCTQLCPTVSTHSSQQIQKKYMALWSLKWRLLTSMLLCAALYVLLFLQSRTTLETSVLIHHFKWYPLGAHCTLYCICLLPQINWFQFNTSQHRIKRWHGKQWWQVLNTTLFTQMPLKFSVYMLLFLVNAPHALI
jgi:hypothetical protein